MEQKLVDLTLSLENEMRRLNYSDNTIKKYHWQWLKLQEYAKQKGEEYYTEKLGIDFLKDIHNIEADNLKEPLSRHEVQILRTIRILGDFQLHQTVTQRLGRKPERKMNAVFEKAKKDFEAYCKNKQLSVSTTRVYIRNACDFMEFLSSKGVSNFSELTQTHVIEFFKTLVNFTNSTINNYYCSLRRFSLVLSQQGTIANDFSSQLPKLTIKKEKPIPAAWEAEELKKLLDAVDRGSPKGKRNYAILSLACRMGLRISDIKNLRFSNINWVAKEINIIQIKTQELLTLPLVPEVGWAIIDYLQNGRPTIDDDHIFITTKAPFRSLSDNDRLSGMVRHYMQIAGITKKKTPCGMHSLRHTLASVLLENNTPLPLISDIIGHVSTNSTVAYLKIDFAQLIQCPIDIEEVIHVE